MNYLLKMPLCIIVCIILNLDHAVGQQIAQFRGVNRDGVYDGTNLLEKWPEAGPKLIWSIEDAGGGFSAPTVSKDAIYITGKIDSMDYLTAYDKSGKKLWKSPIDKVWTGTFPESRCTPVVDDNNVYVVSSYGKVVCFSKKDGKEVWANPVFKEVEGNYGGWGIAESLLLVDDNVIFTPGGLKTTTVALSKKDGKTVWQSESLKDTVDYASAIAVEFGGKKVIFNATRTYAFAIDASNGKILCTYEFDKGRLQPGNVNTPLYKDGRVFFAAGFDAYSYMLELEKDLSKFNLVWKDTLMDSEYGYVVLKDGYIYGANFIHQRKGNWCCTEWETGKLMYETEWQTKGTVSLAGDKLYCMDEKRGNVALVKANPEKFEVISTFKLPKGRGPCWSNPVIKDGIMYIRRGNALMAYNISK